MKRKSTSRRVAKASRKFRVSRRRTFSYTLGTPLKSLAKTQAALFGAVFISMCHPFKNSKTLGITKKIYMYNLKVI